jgi:hypothetical protein
MGRPQGCVAQGGFIVGGCDYDGGRGGNPNARHLLELPPSHSVQRLVRLPLRSSICDGVVLQLAHDVGQRLRIERDSILFVKQSISPNFLLKDSRNAIEDRLRRLLIVRMEAEDRGLGQCPYMSLEGIIPAKSLERQIERLK